MQLPTPPTLSGRARANDPAFVPGSANDGPPLSPSAFYDATPQAQYLPTPATQRHSWTSSEQPWSAATATSSTSGAAHGFAHPGQTISDSDALHRAHSHPSPLHTYDAPMQSPKTLDADDAELTRLEQTRSGIRVPPAPAPEVQLPDSLERAPFADTGVQASLAALRALESPGESLRTIFARQRIFGEPDASVVEMLRESRIWESWVGDEEVRAVCGPRRRRRVGPYPMSEEEVSSGRSVGGRRRRRRADKEMSGRGWVSWSEVDRTESSQVVEPTSKEQSTATTTSPSLLRDRELAAPRLTTSTTQTGSRLTSTKHRTTRSPSTPLVAFPSNDSSSTADPPHPHHPNDRLPRRLHAQHRQRSRSDAHASSTSHSHTFTSSHRTARRDTEKSRYDAQLAQLLLLRDKVLQLESSIGHGLVASDQGEKSFSMDGSVETWSKRRARPSKLGYTVPDIVAWQAGLGGSSSNSNNAVASSTAA